MNPEDNNNIENIQAEEDVKSNAERHEVKGGYTPMTDKQIRKVRLILYIVLGLIAAVIIIVRAVKGAQ